jgi:hypothetical protein
MKRVIVKNLDGIQTHGADMQDPTAWIAKCQESGAWGVDYSVEVIDLDQDPAWLLEQCHLKRAAEYPPAADYLDGIVKGDAGKAQVDKYIADCLAVKAKYPKP